MHYLSNLCRGSIRHQFNIFKETIDISPILSFTISSPYPPLHSTKNRSIWKNIRETIPINFFNFFPF